MVNRIKLCKLAFTASSPCPRRSPECDGPGGEECISITSSVGRKTIILSYRTIELQKKEAFRTKQAILHLSYCYANVKGRWKRISTHHPRCQSSQSHAHRLRNKTNKACKVI